jgi:hypothetical protein
MTFHDEASSASETCAQCSISQSQLRPPAKLKICEGCKSVWYCSEKCQRAARGGHWKECLEIRNIPYQKALSEAKMMLAPNTGDPDAYPTPPSTTTSDYPSSPLPIPGPNYRPVMRTPAEPSIPGKNPRGTKVTPVDIEAIGYSMTHIGMYGPISEDQQYTATIIFLMKSFPHSPLTIAFNLLSSSSAPNAYLSSLSQEVAFYQIIDCFRLRMEDEHVLKLLNLGIYGGGSNRPLWKKYMALVGCSGVLPIGGISPRGRSWR